MVEFIQNITILDISLTLAFIAGLIGSITAIKKVYDAHKTKQREQERVELQAIIETAIEKKMQPVREQLATNQNDLKLIRTELEANNLQTARVDLTTAIEHAPHEHEAILKLGDHYFLELGGDAWMSGIFRKWANAEGVDISYIVEQVPHLKG